MKLREDVLSFEGWKWLQFKKRYMYSPLKPQLNKSQQNLLAMSLIALAVNINAQFTTAPTFTGPDLSFDTKIWPI